MTLVLVEKKRNFGNCFFPQVSVVVSFLSIPPEMWLIKYTDSYNVLSEFLFLVLFDILIIVVNITFKLSELLVVKQQVCWCANMLNEQC